MPESQLTKLRGVVGQIRFKTDSAESENCCSRQKNRVLDSSILWILHLRQRHPELCRARRFPALSVLGGEANFVISAHHRGLSGASELLKNIRNIGQPLEIIGPR